MPLYAEGNTMIPFPKLHIAESVLNRIHNYEMDQEPLGIEVPSPLAPDPTALGVKLEEETEAPVAPAAAPPETQDASNDEMLNASVTGGSPFDGALVGAMEGV